jgi:hypothetical protein
MRIRAVRLGVAIAIMLVAGGCAERVSNTQYQEQLATAEELIAGVVADLPDHDVADADWFEQRRKEVRNVADDFNETEPPRAAQQAHEAYVEGLTGLEQVLNDLSDCARAERQQPGTGTACREDIGIARMDDVRNDLEEGREIFRSNGFRVLSDEAAS